MPLDPPLEPMLTEVLELTLPLNPWPRLADPEPRRATDFDVEALLVTLLVALFAPSV